MLRPIRAPRPPASRVAALAAGFGTLISAVFGVASGPAVADGGTRVTLRPETPSSCVMYNADQGADASNADFVVSVSVAGGNGKPAGNTRVWSTPPG